MNCGNIKQKHHIGIFRMQTMDEVDGFWDLCQDCVEGAAFHLGFTDPEVVPGLEHQLEEFKAMYFELEGKYEGARSAQMSLARENVLLQDEIEELTAPVEISL